MAILFQQLDLFNIFPIILFIFTPSERHQEVFSGKPNQVSGEFKKIIKVVPLSMVNVINDQRVNLVISVFNEIMLILESRHGFDLLIT